MQWWHSCTTNCTLAKWKYERMLSKKYNVLNLDLKKLH